MFKLTLGYKAACASLREAQLRSEVSIDTCSSQLFCRASSKVIGGVY
ncbi:hypothetical protein [Nostoc sp.]